jgi:pSer/pThr/pTyr-binding forkhead associated (FHA) protein
MSVIVRIVHPNGRPIESRVFSSSPISVGRSATSVLRLEDPRVSPQQGVLAFTSEAIQYLDYGSAIKATVDGVPLTPGIPVRLQDSSVVQIGPYRFCVKHPDQGPLPSKEMADDKTDLACMAPGSAGKKTSLPLRSVPPASPPERPGEHPCATCEVGKPNDD